MSKDNQQSLFDRIEGLEKHIHEMFQLHNSAKCCICAPQSGCACIRHSSDRNSSPGHSYATRNLKGSSILAIKEENDAICERNKLRKLSREVTENQKETRISTPRVPSLPVTNKSSPSTSSRQTISSSILDTPPIRIPSVRLSSEASTKILHEESKESCQMTNYQCEEEVGYEAIEEDKERCSFVGSSCERYVLEPVAEEPNDTINDELDTVEESITEEPPLPPIRDIAKSLSIDAVSLVNLAERSQQLIQMQKARVQEVIEERDEKIRKLSDVVEDLEETVVEKDSKNQELEANNLHLREGLESMHQCNAIFVETAEKYKQEMQCGKCCFTEMKQQVIDLQDEIKKARDEIVNLKDKKVAVDAIEKTGKSPCYDCKKLKKIVKDKDEEKERTQKDFCNLEEKHKILQERFHDTSSRIQQDSNVEGMLEMMEMIKVKEQKFQEEKDELKSLICELQTVTNQHQKRAEQFLEINHQQEMFLQQKEIELAAKCKQLQAAQIQAANYKRQSIELQEQYNKGNNNKQLADQIEELRMQLEDEKDTVALKDKVVEDQADTIKQLSTMLIEKKNQLTDARDKIRRSLDATAIVNEEVKWAEQQLHYLKTENCQLRCKLEAEQVDNKVLKKKIVELELNIQQYCKTRAEESANVKAIIADLKSKFSQQQKEWELNMELLAKQKDKAVNAAKFASNMLLQTINDFRKQMINHQTIQETLSKVFREKEPCLCAPDFTPQELCNTFCRAKICNRLPGESNSNSKEGFLDDSVECCSCTDL